MKEIAFVIGFILAAAGAESVTATNSNIIPCILLALVGFAMMIPFAKKGNGARPS